MYTALSDENSYVRNIKSEKDPGAYVEALHTVHSGDDTFPAVQIVIGYDWPVYHGR